MEKDDDYKTTVKCLGPIVEKCVKQNNTIDIYDEYFEGTLIGYKGVLIGLPSTSMMSTSKVRKKDEERSNLYK